jgi:hypothetical protein
MSTKTKPQKKTKRGGFKFFGIAALALVSTIAILASAFYIFNNETPDSASASALRGSANIYPGQSGRFIIKYGNGSPDTVGENGVLTVNIGKPFILETGSFYQLNRSQTDAFSDDVGSDGTRCDDDSEDDLLCKFEKIQANFDSIEKYPIELNSDVFRTTPLYSGVLEYGVESADDVNTPKASLDGADIPMNGEGYISFVASLDPEILSKTSFTTGDDYVPGYVLEHTNAEGIRSVTTFDNVNTTEDTEIAFTIVTLTIDNIGDGECEPASQSIGQSVACFFPLIDPEENEPLLDSDSPFIDDGVTANIPGGSDSDSCTIVGADQISSIDSGSYDANDIPQYLQCTNIPTDNGVTGDNPVTIDFPNSDDGDDKATVNLTDPAPTTVEIGRDNIGNGFCNPNKEFVGTDVTYCAYALVDALGEPLTIDDSVVLPDRDIVANLDTATGNSEKCLLVGSGDVGLTGDDRYLKCDTVPTADGTLGQQDAILIFPDTTRVEDKAFVTLIDQNTTSGCADLDNECRLYFRAEENGELKAVNWDPVTRFNADNADGGYPFYQYKSDDKVFAVFDEIKNSNDELVPDGTECTFNFSDYSTYDFNGLGGYVIYSKTGTTTGGKCEVELDITEQNINYFRVVVEAFDTSTNEIMKGVDTLVLKVGAK